MNAPPEYHGGVSSHFKRAEQAANFGREVGLLYVHAQIRYVEALTKVGKAVEAWRALEQVIPVGIVDTVSNAAARQVNVYFSSSDGDFASRYEANVNFDKLREGSVAVKGGWRLYSSGPGIFINQLISHLCGIRRIAAGLVIDPVLPPELTDFILDFKIEDKPVQFHFVKKGRRSVNIDDQPISVTNMDNP
jgi:cellobiose phosphorylase